MDISSLSNTTAAYFDQIAFTETSLNTDVDYVNSTDEELMEACKGFEAYFLEQVFKEMWNTIPKAEGEDSTMSQLTDYFQENMIQELAKTSTDTNSLGMAQMLYEQMKRTME
ncbi:MAG: rod-binding protein [Eubacteriales bacterium]